MKLIIGLGNPGDKYQNSRHNVGFMVMDELLRKLTSVGKSRWQKVKNPKAEVAKIGDLILAKPQTFMNNSGWPVKQLAEKYHVEPVETWVIHDDLDLPLGKIKIRKGGGTAGHHGLESIVEQLGTTDFVRFRLGIGKPQGHDEWEKTNVRRQKVESYVLNDFLPHEQVEARKMVAKTIEAIELALEKDLDAAMIGLMRNRSSY